MNRRGFLGSILAAGMAPAAISSGVLMPLGKVWVPDQRMTATEVRMHQRMFLESAERATYPPILLLHTEVLRQLMRMGYAKPDPSCQPMVMGASVIWRDTVVHQI